MPTLLNYPTPSFPRAKEVAIFRAYDGILRADPILQSVVRTWASWNGESLDMIDLADGIAASMCPFLRLSPWPIASDRETETQHKMPMQIRTELVVVGTNVDVLMNFAGAVRYAVFPVDDHAYYDRITTILHDAGASRGTITLSAYGAYRDQAEIPILIGEGTIRFGALLPT